MMYNHLRVWSIHLPPVTRVMWTRCLLIRMWSPHPTLTEATLWHRRVSVISIIEYDCNICIMIVIFRSLCPACQWCPHPRGVLPQSACTCHILSSSISGGDLIHWFGSIIFLTLTFQSPNVGPINGVYNAGYPGYPSSNPSHLQSMPVAYQQQPPSVQQLPMGHQIAQTILPPQRGPPMTQQPQQVQAVYNAQSQVSSLPASKPSRPLMASSPLGSSSQEESLTGSGDDNTRGNMRRQMDVASAAGIKCSQFWHRRAWSCA